MTRRLLAVLMVLGLVVAACGTDDAADTTQPAPDTTQPAPTTTEPDVVDTTEPEPVADAPDFPVRIAVFGPFTGAAASIGQEQLNFARLAVEDFNAATGWSVELVEGDTELDPAVGIVVAESVIADGDIYGAVGPAGSQVVDAVGAMMAAANLAHVSPSATDPDLSRNGWATFFRVVPTDDDQGPTVGNYLTETLGAGSVFVIDDQSSYSVGLADQAEATILANGAEVAERASVTQDESDFSALATRIGGSGADAVFFPGQIASQGTLLARAFQDQGIDIILFGADGFFSPQDFIADAAGATDGSYVSSFAPDIRGVPESADIVERFTATYGEFGTFGPPVYAATMVVLEAMQRDFEANGSISREGVTAEVAATDLADSILGSPLSFTEDGDVVGARFYIFQVGDGAFQLLE